MECSCLKRISANGSGWTRLICTPLLMTNRLAFQRFGIGLSLQAVVLIAAIRWDPFPSRRREGTARNRIIRVGRAKGIRIKSNPRGMEVKGREFPLGFSSMLECGLPIDFKQ